MAINWIGRAGGSGTALITFDNFVVVTSSHGGIVTGSWSRGIVHKHKEFVDMARGDHQFLKPFAKRGTSHSVQVEFDSVQAADCSAVYAHMQELADMVTIGNLVIPSKGVSIANCCVEEVAPDGEEIAYVPSGTYSQDFVLTPVYHLPFTLTFRQVK